MFAELLRDGFGEDRYFGAHLAELSSCAPADSSSLSSKSTDPPLPSASMEKNERLVGYALYFNSYCAYQGRTITLEDLFIRSEYRSKCARTGHKTTTSVQYRIFSNSVAGPQ
jgi:hypothetical protein